MLLAPVEAADTGHAAATAPWPAVAAGAVRKNSLVKVLGDGKLTVKVNVTAHKFSGSAKEKITAAGGSTTDAA